MSRYVHEVGDMLEYVTQYSAAYNIIVQDKEGADVVLGDTKTVCDMLDTLYWSRLFISKNESVQDAESQFEKVFKNFLKRRQKDFNLIYQSLYDYTYNPIENYNRMEESDIVKDGHDNNTTSGQNENSYNYGSVDTREDNLTSTAKSNDVNTNSGEDGITKFVSGFNQPNTLNESERELSHYGKSTTSKADSTINNTGTQTNSKTGTDTNKMKITSNTEITYGGTEKTKSTIHGNIGVTTSQQMIIAEVEMRKYNLLENILDEFIEYSTVFM